jgi:hypothetical protein
MTREITHTDYDEAFEYHGNTTIEVIRRRSGNTIWRQWLMFDTVEEATSFFYENCTSNA